MTFNSYYINRKNIGSYWSQFLKESSSLRKGISLVISSLATIIFSCYYHFSKITDTDLPEIIANHQKVTLAFW